MGFGRGGVVIAQNLMSQGHGLTKALFRRGVLALHAEARGQIEVVRRRAEVRLAQHFPVNR